MPMEAPKPQRDPEFYDEDGRVKDPEIARTMAHKQDELFQAKKKVLDGTIKSVENDFNKKEADLKKWMETAPEEIRSKEEREDLIKAPSLLSPEEEARLWERFEKLVNVEVEDGFLKTFMTGEGDNGTVNEDDVSLEDVITLLESLNRISPSIQRRKLMGEGVFWEFNVKHKNGKTSESVVCALNDSPYGKGYGKFVVGIGNPMSNTF